MSQSQVLPPKKSSRKLKKMPKSSPRQYVYEEKSSLEHYTAGAFVVRCFDNRFWRVIKHFIKDSGLKHIDTESLAGGAKVFASPDKPGDADYMLRELDKSIRLHHTKKVMLFTHHDCGAYGGFVKFNGDHDAELKFHEAELKKAAEIVIKHFPQLEVETYFVDDKGVVKVS